MTQACTLRYSRVVEERRARTIGVSGAAPVVTAPDRRELGKELTFKLHHGAKWHDGKPFTAADVKCTFDLIQGKAKDHFRGNPRKDWYHNVDRVTTNGDYEAVFHLKRPQPALLTLLASGYWPIHPCHVVKPLDANAENSTASRRHRDIGDGNQFSPL